MWANDTEYFGFDWPNDNGGGEITTPPITSVGTPATATSSSGLGQSIISGLGGIFNNAANAYIDVEKQKALLTQKTKAGQAYVEGQVALRTAQQQSVNPMFLLLLAGGALLLMGAK